MDNRVVAGLLAVAVVVASQPALTFGSGGMQASPGKGSTVVGQNYQTEVARTVYNTAYNSVNSIVYGDDVNSSVYDQRVLELTLAQAIELGLQHNFDLAAVGIDLEFRELDQDKADYYSDQQRDADSQIKKSRKQLQEAQAQLNQIPDGTILPAGTKLPDGTVLPVATPKEYLVAQLAAKAQQLEELSKYSIDTLAEAQVAELIEEKARVGLVVTQLGQRVAEQKVRVGIQKAYYDALQAHYLVAAKEKAYNRVQAQYTMAKAAFDVGMRAKDDMLLAHAQAQLMKADWEKAKNSYELALLELTKLMGIQPNQKIQLKDDFTTQSIQATLEKDVQAALTKRLEIRKAQGELDVYRLNAELAERYTSGTTFDTREAKLNVKKTENELARQKVLVEAEVRQSYNTLLATQAMLQYIDKAKVEAQESVDIATLRYKEGYIFINGVLKNLNAEDSAGTIIEVLAAEEKLSEIEEKSVSIMYGYNLARSKYQLDIGQGL